MQQLLFDYGQSPDLRASVDGRDSGRHHRHHGVDGIAPRAAPAAVAARKDRREGLRIYYIPLMLVPAPLAATALSEPFSGLCAVAFVRVINAVRCCRFHRLRRPQ